MSFIEGIRGSYSTLGVRGVFLTAKARLLPQLKTEATSFSPRHRHPVHLRMRTSDVSLYRDVIVRPQYDWDLGAPRVIVDAGAQIGLASAFFATKYPTARIISLEPEPSNLAMARRNLGGYPNVSIVASALWRSCCNMRIVDVGSVAGFQVVEDPQGAIRATTIDAIMADFRLDYIDVLKVDIEGCEKEVFENCRHWIDRVGCILIELHERLKPGCYEAVEHALGGFLQSTRGEVVFYHH